MADWPTINFIAKHQNVEETPVPTAYDRCVQNQVHTVSVLGIRRNVVRTQVKRFGVVHGEIEATESAPVAAG